MKNIYLSLIAFLGFSLALTAQTVSVTFNVDMNGQTVGANGVHMAGNFNTGSGDTPINTALPNWNPSGIELTDPDNDGIYSVTLDLAPANYEYKILNGNDWGTDESVPAACQVELGLGNNNRFFNVSAGADPFTIEHCFARCGPCGQTTVHIRVDLANELESNPNAAGFVVGELVGGFENFVAMQPWRDSETIYSIFINLPASSTGNTYFFATEADFLALEVVEPGDCSLQGARNLVISAEQAGTDILVPLVCFGSCESCIDPVMVTFNVDMSLVETVSPDGVHIAGAFQGWNPSGTPLTEGDNNIWSVTLPIDPGTYGFKFINGNNWGFDESVPVACRVGNDRQLIVEAGMTEMTFTVCYAQCTEECITNPDPAPITFLVDLADEPVHPSGVWLMGTITTPQWQQGAIQMNEVDGEPGIYRAILTVSGVADIFFKFSNGNPQLEGLSEGEFDGAINPGDCAVDNGFGNWNRTHTRSGSPETIAFVINTCNVFVGVNEITGRLEGVKAFPNPVRDNLTVTFQNQGVYQIMITDLTGKLVRNYNQIAQPVFQINKGSLSNGMYVMQIVNEKGEAASIKLIVQ
ncbi:MAG: T9SS type A sorting domain-containing protein [Luteibaculaceae bacterium]